jgi:tetratricopeptide (TPR) repeat protein
MGILYKRLGVPTRAVSSIQKALEIKRESIGHQSLPVAKILEEIGKYHLERSELAKAFPYFQECYEIRKKILRKSTDEEVQRISCLLLYLHKNIERQIRDKSAERVEQ